MKKTITIMMLIMIVLGVQSVLAQNYCPGTGSSAGKLVPCGNTGTTAPPTAGKDGQPSSGKTPTASQRTYYTDTKGNTYYFDGTTLKDLSGKDANTDITFNSNSGSSPTHWGMFNLYNSGDKSYYVNPSGSISYLGPKSTVNSDYGQLYQWDTGDGSYKYVDKNGNQYDGSFDESGNTFTPNGNELVIRNIPTGDGDKTALQLVIKDKDGNYFEMDKNGNPGNPVDASWSWGNSGYRGTGVQTGYEFLSGLVSGLSGYSWQSYFYGDDEEGALLGHSDNEFNKLIMNGAEDTFISLFCSSPSSDSDDNRVIVGGPSGGNAGGWMASEYVPYVYYNMTTGKNTTGRIYKISAEFVPGSCTKMQLKLTFNDGTAIITDSGSGNAFLFKMGTDYPESSGGVSSISYTGSSMIMKFSTNTYSKTCVTFTELSSGCLSSDVEINKPYCWNIQSSAEVYAKTIVKAIESNDPDSADTGDSGSGSTSGTPTNGNW